MEFYIHGQEYGLLIEGDRGNLSFQGTRYLGFDRGIKERIRNVRIINSSCICLAACKGN